MKKLLKVYVVCMKLTVGFLLHLEKHGQVKSIGDDKIEVLCMENGRASYSFVWLENEDLGWYSYYEILCYCIINLLVPETGQAFVLSRQDLDKIYEFMLQH